MKTQQIIFFTLLFTLACYKGNGQDQDKSTGEFTMKLGVEDRFFLNNGLYEGQKRNYLSIAAEPEYSFKWNEKKSLAKATLFGRYDQYDTRRTHFDIRELYWQRVQNNHEISIGIKKIFWGVTESAHIVNVINQPDIVESFDGEEKLGQPMIHYSYQSKKGTFDFFYMPYFRKPTFPGKHGRLRTPFLIDKSMIAFESSMEEYRPDVAVRWSHYIGKFDFGLSHFYGTSRQPLIESLENFRPVFAIVNQTGLDLQATTGPILWKLESIYNANHVTNYTALAAGFEYTFGNVNRKGLDIGLLGEYLYDSRDALALTSLQNDVFGGTRFAFNNTQDSQILAGAIFDLERKTWLYSVEASQRIKESWKIELEGRFFGNVSEREFIYFIRKDSFLKLAVNKYL
jgi:hypothetical protein